MHILNMWTNICKVSTTCVKSVGEVDYKKKNGFSNDSFYKKWQSFTICKISEKILQMASSFFIRIFNMLKKHSANFQRSGSKAVGGVDYTK